MVIYGDLNPEKYWGNFSDAEDVSEGNFRLHNNKLKWEHHA